jgi:hypothetical protein
MSLGKKPFNFPVHGEAQSTPGVARAVHCRAHARKAAAQEGAGIDSFLKNR